MSAAAGRVGDGRPVPVAVLPVSLGALALAGVAGAALGSVITRLLRRQRQDEAPARDDAGTRRTPAASVRAGSLPHQRALPLVVAVPRTRWGAPPPALKSSRAEQQRRPSAKHRSHLSQQKARESRSRGSVVVPQRRGSTPAFGDPAQRQPWTGRLVDPNGSDIFSTVPPSPPLGANPMLSFPTFRSPLSPSPESAAGSVTRRGITLTKVGVGGPAAAEAAGPEGARSPEPPSQQRPPEEEPTPPNTSLSTLYQARWPSPFHTLHDSIGGELVVPPGRRGSPGACASGGGHLAGRLSSSSGSPDGESGVAAAGGAAAGGAAAAGRARIPKCYPTGCAGRRVSITASDALHASCSSAAATYTAESLAASLSRARGRARHSPTAPAGLRSVFGSYCAHQPWAPCHGDDRELSRDSARRVSAHSMFCNARIIRTSSSFLHAGSMHDGTLRGLRPLDSNVSPRTARKSGEGGGGRMSASMGGGYPGGSEPQRGSRDDTQYDFNDEDISRCSTLASTGVRRAFSSSRDLAMHRGSRTFYHSHQGGIITMFRNAAAARTSIPLVPIHRIIVTGGPCSGKSTCMEYLCSELKRLNYNVYTVPEVATLLFNGGLRFGCESRDQRITQQRIVLQLMMMLEDCFYEDAYMWQKPAVILYDRGTMDGSAYCTEDEWEEVLSISGYTNEELRDARYDAVIHLVTVAIGASEYYTRENNAARRETPEEAAVMDAKTRQAWCGHSLVTVIDNSTGFQRKLERALAAITRIFGVSSNWRSPAIAPGTGQPAAADVGPPRPLSPPTTSTTTSPPPPPTPPPARASEAAAALAGCPPGESAAAGGGKAWQRQSEFPRYAFADSADAVMPLSQLSRNLTSQGAAQAVLSGRSPRASTKSTSESAAAAAATECAASSAAAAATAAAPAPDSVAALTPWDVTPLSLGAQAMGLSLSRRTTDAESCSSWGGGSHVGTWRDSLGRLLGATEHLSTGTDDSDRIGDDEDEKGGLVQEVSLRQMDPARAQSILMEIDASICGSVCQDGPLTVPAHDSDGTDDVCTSPLNLTTYNRPPRHTTSSFHERARSPVGRRRHTAGVPAAALGEEPLRKLHVTGDIRKVASLWVASLHEPDPQHAVEGVSPAASGARLKAHSACTSIFTPTHSQNTQGERRSSLTEAAPGKSGELALHEPGGAGGLFLDIAQVLPAETSLIIHSPRLQSHTQGKSAMEMDLPSPAGDAGVVDGVPLAPVAPQTTPTPTTSPSSPSSPSPPATATAVSSATVPTAATPAEEPVTGASDEAPSAPALAPVALAGGCTNTDNVLQAQLLVEAVDEAQIPSDCVTAEITIIVLRPMNTEYLSEIIIRRVGAGARPVYLHKAEFIAPLVVSDSTAQNDGELLFARNVSTRQITKREFVILAGRMDAAQPLLKKVTHRFFHNMRHLTLVTFKAPDDLAGVRRLVGPPDMTPDDVPPWISLATHD